MLKLVFLFVAVSSRCSVSVPLPADHHGPTPVDEARKIGGTTSNLVFDLKNFGKLSIGTEKPKVPASGGTFLASPSTSSDTKSTWSILGIKNDKPTLPGKAGLDSLTSGTGGFFPSIPKPSFSSIPTPTFGSFPSSSFPSFPSLDPASLFPSGIPKPSLPSFSLPKLKLPGVARADTFPGVPAPQTQMLVIRYPNIAQFLRNGIDFLTSSFSTISNLFSGGLGNFFANNRITISAKEPTEFDDLDV
ncbi:uncharacterized protein LOC108666736 [Hyalella azteca]|uniref:Uncharacterized protein LOC108666736 n=1 Tax=Hyalella azteca TaxID=294128 RepID=A0A8B7N6A3_HYAAZ|nr:uncharacterized protein LOC108666736 [Hyalella azteca]